MDISEAAARDWDVIIIGSGMGGGVAGRRLAEQGLSVLYLEKGPAGYRTEHQSMSPELHDPQARLLRGYWPTQLHARVNNRDSRFFAPLGSGVGGSSVFYAGALERPALHDFESTADLPHPTGGWPVDYAGFRAYYDEVAELMQVCGTPDPLSGEQGHPPLRPPPEASEGEARLMADWTDALGLHPYRQHMSFRLLPGCKLCLGMKCPRLCKMDGRSGGVEPALATGNAALLDRCEVRELRASDGRVTGVIVRRDGTEQTLTARAYVLAAGALSSPRLLLASRSLSPDGLANSSGWVGRGLMFHLREVFAVWPKRGEGYEGTGRTMSLRDFYTVEGQRMGLVQSLGFDASYGIIAQHLKSVYDRSALGRFPRMRRFMNVPALIGSRVLGNAKVFVGLLEDLPYHENRVLPSTGSQDEISIEYSISDELLERRKLYRRALKRAFRSRRILLLGNSPDLEFGHSCGTLRFGNDPRTSVLDADCKAHDLENLYVADASFMPTSTGVNPSLTIAANALRVADRLAARFPTMREVA